MAAWDKEPDVIVEQEDEQRILDFAGRRHRRGCVHAVEAFPTARHLTGKGCRVLSRSPEGTLRALNIPVEFDRATGRSNVKVALRRALVFYHPDRYQVSMCHTPVSY